MSPPVTQGTSAGSAALAYTMVWYGAGSYLNNVEKRRARPVHDAVQEEGVSNGTDPDSGLAAVTAIENDMTAHCVAPH